MDFNFSKINHLKRVDGMISNLLVKHDVTICYFQDPFTILVTGFAISTISTWLYVRLFFIRM